VTVDSSPPQSAHNLHPDLLENEISTEHIVRLWTEILSVETKAGAVDLLCLEFWLSRGYSQVIHTLPKKYTYSKTLLTVRQRVAISLHDYARELNWRRPVMYVTALKMARAYLRDAVGHESAMREDLRKEFTGRLGVSTVLISRFERVSHGEVRECRLALQRSLIQGNEPKSALPYLVEAAVVEYDLTGDPLGLKDVLNACASFDESADSETLRLAQVDANLRLMEFADPDDRRLLRREVDNLLDSVCGSQDAEINIRRAMALGLLQAQDEGIPDAVHVQGVRFPFGYRDSEALHLTLSAAAPKMYERLMEIANRGEPMAIGVLADILTEERAPLAIEPGLRLRRAIDLRKNLRASDVRADLLNLRDRAALAQIDKDTEARRAALLGLAGLVSKPLTAAPALVLLARNVESAGGIPMPIIAGTPPDEERALRLVAAGNHESLWNMAAEAALADVNLTIIRLGGRSEVTTVGDYYGLSAEEFVFKQGDPIAFERDSSREELIRRYVEAKGYEGVFGVPVNLATCRPIGIDDTKVVVARRYVRGTCLQEALATEDLECRVANLADAARFLGLINLAEHSDSATGARVELKKKEMGRWLRNCGLGDPGATFDAWWAVMQQGMLVRRRDAHLGNWLRADDGRLIAMDLEAQGWRPVGYDLAQISDDHVFLDIRDWVSRRVIFEAYREARKAPGDSGDSEWVAYQAGVLARLVWGLTNPNDGPFDSGVAEFRLHGFADSVESEVLSGIASEILAAWLKRRGLVELPKRLGRTDGAGRIRLSRAMAYHLRHDRTLSMDRGGWTNLGDLAAALQRGATPELLATVATDRREARFELSEGRVRARYGHSLAVQLDYRTPSRALTVYHASPWKYASSILDQCQGLDPGKRQWVHLTDSLAEAVANGVREGHPLVYQVSSADLPNLLAASTHTFIARSVLSDAMSVVPMSAYWDQIPTIERSLAPTDCQA